MHTKETKNTVTKAYTNGQVKIMRFIGMLLIAVILFTMPAFASANFGEKGGTWVLEQIFWVGLIGIAIVVVKFLMAGNYIKMLITGGVGAIALVVIQNPQRLKTLGDTIWTTVFGG